MTVANTAETGAGGADAAYGRAEDTVVTDDLPSPLTCSDVSVDVIAGVASSCTGSTITWTVATIDAGTSTGLTYTATMPLTLGPGQSLTNTATLVSYEQTNNDAGTTAYVSGSTADVTLDVTAATVAKLQRTSIGESGNSQNGSLATTAEEATIGETISYQIAVDLPPGVVIHDGYLEDDLPSGVTIVGGSVSATVDLGEGGGVQAVPAAGFAFDGGSNATRVNFPTPLATGSNTDRIVISFDVTVDDIPANIAAADLDNIGHLYWRASVSGPVQDATSPTRTTTIVEPNPQITKTDDDGDGIVAAGQVLTYSLSVTNPDLSNTRGSTAHDLVVVDTVPTHLDPVLPIPGNGVWASGPRTITWNAAAVAGLASVDVDATAIVLTYDATVIGPVPVGLDLTNDVTVTATSMAGTVAGERTTYSDDASNTVTTLDATMTKALDPDSGPYTIGEPVAYQLDVTLPTELIAYDMTATDTIPDGLVFDSTTAITPNGSCSITGDTGLTITDVTATGDTSVAFFLGDVEASGGACVITIEYVTHVDQTYNGTGSPADGVLVDSGDTLVNSSRLNWMVTDTVTTTPTVLGDFPSSWDDQTVIVSETITVSEPQLVLDKDVTTVVGCDSTHSATGTPDDDDCTTQPGAGPFTYTITVRNSGTEPAHDIVVTDQPDAELINVTPVTGAADITDGWTVGDPAMQWEVAGPLAVGASLTLTYTADLVASASLTGSSSIANTADVPTYFGLDAAARTASSDEQTYGGAVGPVVADTVTLTPEFPTLGVAKTVASGAETDQAFLGTSFEWRITTTNNTTVATADDVDLSDTLPINWAYDAGSAQLCVPGCSATGDPTITGTLATGIQLDWSDLASLAAGGSFEVRFTASPDNAVLTTPGVGASISHVNTVSATGDDASGAGANGDGNYAASPDTASAQIRQTDLSLTKQILTAGPYLQGQAVDYRIVVTNDGPDTATGIQVDEILDGGQLLWTATVSADGSYNSGTGVWSVPDLANAATATLDLRVEIIGSGSITNTAQIIASDQYDTDSTPNNAASTVEDDEDSVTISAGTASLGSTVWYDVDNSGDDESNKGVEPGIPGVTVNLASAGNDLIFGNADDFWGPDGISGTGDDITVTSLVTNSMGAYSFTGLPDGTYRVSVDTSTMPGGASGWTQTYDDNGAGDDTSGDIVLVAGSASYVDADFSYTGAGSLGDQVFWDVDSSADGVLAGSDQPITDVGVGLTWAGFDGTFGTSDDVTYPNDSTDVSGEYGFDDLPPGDYRVTVDESDTDFPDGMDTRTWDVEHTGPGGGDGEPSATAEVTLAAGADRTDVDFSYTGSGSIGDTVWLDLDGDGIVDPNESGIPNVDVTLTWYGPDGVAGGGDDQTLTTTTDASGNYTFEGLPAGSFSVVVDTADSDFPAGVAPSFDLDGTGTADTAVVTLTSGQTRTDVDFGYRGLGSIGDLVWLDLDGDATIDTGEPGIGGVDIAVSWAGADGTFGTADDVVVNTTTSSTGAYDVDGLPYGSYRVAVGASSLPDAVAPTYDLDGIGTANEASTTLDGVTPDRTDVDFGYQGTASIGDLVWTDLDGDGVVDPGEDPIPGVEITVTVGGADGLLGTDDDLVIVVTTDADGEYLVGGLPAGPVTVAITGGVPADHAHISDPDDVVDGSWTTSLDDGDVILIGDYGLRPDADVSITKTHDGSFTVGENGTFTLAVLNAGPAAATSVQVTDILPTGLTFVSATGAICAAAGATVTCQVSDLVANDSVTITLTVTVAASAAPGVTNSVSVSSDTADRQPDNNSDTDDVDVPLAQLTISKAVIGTLTAGQSATYRIAVVNAGPSPATSVEVSDTLPSSLSYQTVVGDDWTCAHADGVVSCQLGVDLPAGGSVSVDVVVTVSASATGSITNNAQVLSGTSQIDYTDDATSATEPVISPELAFTGSTVFGVIATGSALVLTGAALTIFGRGRVWNRGQIRVE